MTGTFIFSILVLEQSFGLLQMIILFRSLFIVYTALDDYRDGWN